jgi:hypothetical protein
MRASVPGYCSSDIGGNVSQNPDVTWNVGAVVSVVADSAMIPPGVNSAVEKLRITRGSVVSGYGEIKLSQDHITVSSEIFLIHTRKHRGQFR